MDSIAGVEHGVYIEGLATKNHSGGSIMLSELGPVAADKLMVNNSDVIEWRFEIPPWVN